MTHLDMFQLSWNTKNKKGEVSQTGRQRQVGLCNGDKPALHGEASQDYTETLPQKYQEERKGQRKGGTGQTGKQEWQVREVP